MITAELPVLPLVPSKHVQTCSVIPHIFSPVTSAGNLLRLPLGVHRDTPGKEKWIQQ